MAYTITGTPAADVETFAKALGLDLGTGEAPGSDAGRRAEVERAWSSAVAELDFQLEDAFRPITAAVLDGLRLDVAQEFWSRLDRVSSGSQYVDPSGGQPVRGPRDPLNRAYPILDRYRTPL